MVAASAVLFVILKTITTVLFKAFMFTFIAKFLVSTNWKPSDNSFASKINSHSKGNVMILME